MKSYDEYVFEINERGERLISSEAVSTEDIYAVHVKFCMDPKWIDEKSEESKEVITLIHHILRTKMADTNARSRIENLFISYHSLLRRNCFSWILMENQNGVVHHVLSAIRPTSLKVRLSSHLEFGYHDLRQDFRRFMGHSVKLAQELQLVDNRKPNSEDNGSNTSRKLNRGGHKSTYATKQSSITSEKQGIEAVVFLYGPHKSRDLPHYLRDCHECAEDERKALLKQLAEFKTKTGLWQSTGGQLGSTKAYSSKKAKRLIPKLHVAWPSPIRRWTRQFWGLYPTERSQ